MFRTPLAIWLVLVAALVAGSAMATTTTVPAWSLIPQPAVLQPAASGAVRVADGDRVVVEANGNQGAYGIARRFVARMAATRGLHLRVHATGGHGRIVFHLDPTVDIQPKASYRIDIGQGQIRVSAHTLRGLFYGGVTLGQLLTPDAGHGAVRVADGSVIDHPRFAWRGFMLDSARHFQSVADIKKMIDWMALHKLDVLHWHLTDDQGWRLQIKRYPKLTTIGACRKVIGPDAALTGGPDKPYCGFYTQDQVRELVRYAAQRFITIVPEIEIPGHAQAAIAAYPELGVTGRRPEVSTDWGINAWLYAPDQRSLHFLENVLDEVMALFPSRYIHVGGDEAYKAQWKASPEVRARLKQLGLKDMDALQGWMIDRIGAYLDAHGRTLIGWDEILSGGSLPKSAVVMSWHGVSGAVKAAEAGHDAILSPSPVLYLDHVQSSAHDEPPARPSVESLKDVYMFNPSPAGLTSIQANHILGVQANLWTEYMPTFARDQFAVFPRMAAWAEVAWSPAAAIDWSSFIRRMPAQLARYQALGIRYADSAWAPRFTLARQGDDIQVALSNQTGQGEIRYTTDGSTPTPHSSAYTQALELPANKTTMLRAATFTDAGQLLAAPRTRHIDAASLLTRNSDQLATCTQQIPLRIEDDRPLHGSRPVYKVDIGNTCWLWKNAPLDGVRAITLRVGNLPWNYKIPYVFDSVVARPQATPGGEIDVHLDTCDGPRIARLPLAGAAKSMLQTTLEATLPELHGMHTLCLFATGDPRKGTIRVIDTVRLSHAKP
ncbi:MAG TPA: family 20 glycosylhydrolase [Oleiagrimonas sp.]|nr:family 20 glycosylhydrolase [Oleiagrimonas sp.]